MTLSITILSITIRNGTPSIMVLSIKISSIIPIAIYAECHVFILLCWVSLCWVSLWWLSLCWLSLCWLSLCWLFYADCFMLSIIILSIIILSVIMLSVIMLSVIILNVIMPSVMALSELLYNKTRGFLRDMLMLFPTSIMWEMYVKCCRNQMSSSIH